LDIRSVNLSRAAYGPAEFPRDGRPQFAIAGRSNVGKSSFINALLKRKKMARISRTPGKTRGIHFYLVNEEFYVVDLPGYGYARAPRQITASWGDLLRGYLESGESLRMIFLLLDVRRTPSPQDRQMLDWIEAAGIDAVLVLTKSDKVSGRGLAASRAAIAKELGRVSGELVAFSAMTRQGIEQLRGEIVSRIRIPVRGRQREL
jgi:GTP-binding protein